MRETAKPMDVIPKPSQGTAILCLFDVSGQSLDWYWREIAGVPFILRNILNIQCGGVDHLVVHSNKLDDCNKAFLRAIDNDPRILLKLEWIQEPKQLALSAKEEGALMILDGSALHSKSDVANALEIVDGSNNKSLFVFPLQNKTLKTLLENIDTFSPAGFEKLLYEDAKAGFVGKKRNLIFIPGTKETLIATEADFAVQHELLLGTCGLNHHSFMGRRVTQSLSKSLTRSFLKTSLTPNLITGISFILGLCSAFFFYQGSYWSGIIGAAMMQVSAWIDGAVGEVARLKLMESKAGSRLGLISRNIVNGAVFIAVGMGLVTMSGNVLYWQCGQLAVLGSFVSFLVLWSTDLEKESPGNKKSGVVEKISNRDFTYVLLFMALIDQLGMFILAAAVGANAFAVLLLYEKARPTLIPIKNGVGK